MRYNIITESTKMCFLNPTGTGQTGKEVVMDEMTDKQFDDAKETLIRLILEMMKNSKDIEEAMKKVEALLNQ